MRTRIEARHAFALALTKLWTGTAWAARCEVPRWLRAWASLRVVRSRRLSVRTMIAHIPRAVIQRPARTAALLRLGAAGWALAAAWPFGATISVSATITVGSAITAPVSRAVIAFAFFARSFRIAARTPALASAGLLRASAVNFIGSDLAVAVLVEATECIAGSCQFTGVQCAVTISIEQSKNAASGTLHRPWAALRASWLVGAAFVGSVAGWMFWTRGVLRAERPRGEREGHGGSE